MPSTIRTAGGEFLVDETGDPTGPPLVFVAGLGDDHTSWSGVIDEFRDFRCVTFDNRGIGGSVTSAGPYTVTQLAEDAHAVCGALELVAPTVIGSSMGGAICQEWLLAHPGSIRRAVLTNTWAQRDPFCTILFEHLIALAEQGLRSELARASALFGFSPGFLAAQHDVEWADGSGFNLPGFAAAAQACAGHDALARLHGIEQPVLVIAGARDILTRLELSVQLERRLPRGELTTIDAGHMTFQEDPGRWSAIVADWLRRDL